MPSWLRSLMKRSSDEGVNVVLDLLVVEGADAGHKFTIDGDEVMIGRAVPDETHARGIRLRDPTVSSKQAVLRQRGGSVVLQHLAGATNPTLIDGVRATGQPLKVGSRIQMGRVVMEVRERSGPVLSELTAMGLPADRAGTGAAADRIDATEEVVVPDIPGADEDTTQVRVAIVQYGELLVERGFAAAAKRSYPIWSTGTVIGRANDCHVQLVDMGVSRRHAEIVVEDGRMVLVHLSTTNATLLNGCEVLDRQTLKDGDCIDLADLITLRVCLDELTDVRPVERTAPRAPLSLKQEMEQKIALERRIEEQFHVQGSFVDIDVVNSYGMKASSNRAEHIIVSFERFRAFVGGTVEEFGGHVLNSNGDELMCYFEDTLSSVRSASQILERLDDFNEKENLLRIGFRFRIGIHTGTSLVDLDQGVAYSTTLDIAGHLQKLAAANELVVSQATLDALPEGMPFEPAGVMEREEIPYYRLTGSID